MKQVSVRECPAGLWLDTAVEALGAVACDEWTPVNYPVAGYIKNCQHDKCYPRGYPAQYSTNIMAAWRLVEKLVHDHEFYIANYFYSQSPGWSVNYRQNSVSDWKSVDGGTAPLAIARAFLKAKGVEFVEVPE